MIEIKNIEKSFVQGNTTQKVLRGINLKVNNGDFITIMGPSGGGKSTLLYTLALLSEPNNGEVLFNNKIVNYKNEKEIEKLRRKNIGIVFQNSNLISCLTALENIIIAIDSNEKYSVKKERAEGFLKKVGLFDKRMFMASSLSGGEAQRIAIVRALVNNPRVILCDEPTGALDSENGKNMISILIKMKKEVGCALIIVTHDMNIGKMGDKQLFLRDGVINEMV